MKRTATRLARLGAVLVLTVVPALAQTPELPAPSGFVNDYASVVDAASRERMETMARNFRDRTGIDVAVVTLQSLDGRAIEDVGIDLARKWGIGGGADKDGVLVLLAVQDRRSRIETSRKLDDEITDGVAGSILRKARPFFAQEQYGQGLQTALESVLATIAEKRGISIDGIDARQAYSEQRPERRPSGGSWTSRIVFLVVLVFMIWIFTRGAGGGGWGGGGRRRRYGSSGWVAPIIIPGGWGSGGGGSWGGGGGGGGGGSWGGFGGGGDFGGGGASDSW